MKRLDNVHIFRNPLVARITINCTGYSAHQTIQSVQCTALYCTIILSGPMHSSTVPMCRDNMSLRISIRLCRYHEAYPWLLSCKKKESITTKDAKAWDQKKTNEEQNRWSTNSVTAMCNKQFSPMQTDLLLNSQPPLKPFISKETRRNHGHDLDIPNR